MENERKPFGAWSPPCWKARRLSVYRLSLSKLNRKIMVLFALSAHTPEQGSGVLSLQRFKHPASIQVPHSAGFFSWYSCLLPIRVGLHGRHGNCAVRRGKRGDHETEAENGEWRVRRGGAPAGQVLRMSPFTSLLLGIYLIANSKSIDCGPQTLVASYIELFEVGLAQVLFRSLNRLVRYSISTGTS